MFRCINYIVADTELQIRLNSYIESIPIMAAPFILIGTTFILLAVLFAAWELAWKGLALWRAARNGHKGWFIAILMVNTLGVLPIIYLLNFSRPSGQHSSSNSINKRSRAKIKK